MNAHHAENEKVKKNCLRHLFFSVSFRFAVIVLFLPKNTAEIMMIITFLLNRSFCCRLTTPYL
jgi:hypothetical protein